MLISAVLLRLCLYENGYFAKPIFHHFRSLKTTLTKNEPNSVCMDGIVFKKPEAENAALTNIRVHVDRRLTGSGLMLGPHLTF